MPGSKQGKNGKESGGVVAAVTKHGVKFTNGDVSGNTPSTSPSPPPLPVSPDAKASPFLQSSAPPPAAGLAGNDFMAPSPLLDAISTTSFATSHSPNTREWARGIAAGMAGSPGNLISLSGESPPTLPSSYEDTRAPSSGWSSPRPGATYHPPPGPSVSPPTAARRPLSFQLDANCQFPSAADMPNQAASVAPRRSSMHSHFAQIRASPNPPLPHQPQPHFYTAPEIDLDLQARSGMLAGEKGYFFGFDSLPLPSGDATPGRDTVAVAGYEGGLEVHLLGKRGLERVASLKGLRGGVYNAKILPWTASGTLVPPLIAVVMHGPCLPLPTPGIHVVENGYDAVSADRSEAMTSGSADAPARDGGNTRAAPGFVEAYQTTVEVYSLRTGKLVEVLLQAPKIPLKMPITSPVFQAPPPTGAFQIKADAGNMAVASGATGECWLFRHHVDPAHRDAHFLCLGKVWTSLQQPPKGPLTPEISDRGRMAAAAASPRPRPRPQSAIFSLHGTLLAYCPAAPSSQIALRASVAVSAQGRAPGLMSLTPPQLPVTNSELDLPMSESVMNKIMRDATQELIHGAKWVGKQGWQAWNNYWNPQSSQTPRSPTLQAQAQAWGGLPGVRNEASQFPPTHGSLTPPTPKEPGLVSILDLETLGASSSVHPLTTFQLSNGCSFLSFSPTGLSLFTASTKGDIQTVWDFMRIQYTKSSPLQTAMSPATGPRVRQVAQFSRMTVARVVDVTWTRPNGQRAAMVTERGTVHLLDLPPSAFTWPPPRRRSRPQETPGTTAEGNPSAASIASTALSSVREAARPLMARPRRSVSNVPQQAGSGIGDYATHGGKVIAASISHSLGRTGNAINQLRHTGENRVSLPSPGANTPGVSCVAWITGRRDHYLFVLGSGLVRTFPTKGRKAPAGSNKRAPRMTRYKDYKLPCLPDDTIAPAVKRIIDPDEYLDFGDRDSDAGNTMHPLLQLRARSAPSANVGTDSSIPQAEIESSAPYQPFHTDRRVSLFELGSILWPDDAAMDDPAKPNLILPPAIPLMMIPDKIGEDIPGAPVGRGRPGRPSRAAAQPWPDRLQVQKAATAGDDWGAASGGVWVFGQPIQATQLDVGLPRPSADEEPFDAASAAADDSRSLPPSAMERVLHRYGEGHANDDQIVVTTRRRRGTGAPGHGPNLDDDGFFEDDCEVLDFADQRV